MIKPTIKRKFEKPPEDLSKFKIGDKVICIFDRGWVAAENHLEEGKTYIVFGLDGGLQVTDGTPGCTFTEFRYDSNRFQTIAEQRKEKLLKLKNGTENKYLPYLQNKPSHL